MSTIKTDRVDFEKLLNGIDPVDSSGVSADPGTTPASTTAPVNSVVDNTSAAETMEVKMFDYDYDAVRKGLRKKARKTILNMVNHIIPEDIINEDYIQDKIEQDIETLTGLYMQLENNTIMQRSLMDSVSKGNSMPRMYEVFTQMTDKLQSINEQIVNTEQKIRKTYVDLKFEVRDKMSEDATNNMLSGPSNMAIENGGVIVTNAKDLINDAKAKRIEALKKAKETEFEEQK
jgi:hypothetical protein